MRPASGEPPAAAACLVSRFIASAVVVVVVVATAAASASSPYGDEIEDGLAAAVAELQTDSGPYRARPAAILRRVLNYKRTIDGGRGGIRRVQPDDVYYVGNFRTLRSRPASRKRNCRFNLGGHCDTENAAALVTRWHNLNSAWSPGRRRRRRASENGDAGSLQTTSSTSTSTTGRPSFENLPFNVLYRQLVNNNNRKLTSAKSIAAPSAQFSSDGPTSPVVTSSVVTESNVGRRRRCFRVANDDGSGGVTCVDEDDGNIVDTE